MTQMKLGWWRARNGVEHKVDINKANDSWPWWSSVSKYGWDKDGYWNMPKCESDHDLVEFIRQLDTELPPALNAAVKATENMVRELKQMVDETQTAWATACRLHEAAQKELERLEKECEVKP